MLLTAASVVGADQHFPFDAIGGVATGMAVVLASCAVIDRVTKAHRASDRTAIGLARADDGPR